MEHISKYLGEWLKQYKKETGIRTIHEAHEIKNAIDSDLLLDGKDEYGTLQWTGTEAKHDDFKERERFFEETGDYKDGAIFSTKWGKK